MMDYIRNILCIAFRSRV